MTCSLNVQLSVIVCVVDHLECGTTFELERHAMILKVNNSIGYASEALDCCWNDFVFPTDCICGVSAGSPLTGWLPGCSFVIPCVIKVSFGITCGTHMQAHIETSSLKAHYRSISTVYKINKGIIVRSCAQLQYSQLFITVNLHFSVEGVCACACWCVQTYACSAVSHWSQNLFLCLSQSPASSLSNKGACFKNAWNCHKECVLVTTHVSALSRK